MEEDVLVVVVPKFNTHEEFLNWFDNVKPEDFKPFYPNKLEESKM